LDVPKTNVRRERIRRALSLFVVSIVISCVASDARPGSAPPPASSDTDSVIKKPVVVPPQVAAGPDTMTPHLIPGRSTHDSAAFASAVAFGRRQLAKWPEPPTPLPGSILPAKRIVAFYGNPLSKRMGVLGEYPPEVMLAKLDTMVRQWNEADPTTPVQPALHLIAVVAQGAPGKDGMWRSRMDSAMIEKVYGWAKQRNALLFLDVQVGKSTMQRELPHLMPFLARPDVHLGMDAEFSMHYAAEGSAPSKRIGQFDAADVNWVSEQLRQLVDEKKLPPKVLVVHRWTKSMISHASRITIDPRVQIVMHMDGWGPPWMKFESYRDYIDLEPVEFTGFKIFFHNDTKRKDALLTPGEILWLRPRPIYIQYQ
jgi:hypothetical protein